MIKLLKALLVVSAVGLSGCGQGNPAQKFNLNMPDELKDCNTYLVSDNNLGSYIITRCPNSSTNMRYGKNGQTSTIEN